MRCAQNSIGRSGFWRRPPSSVLLPLVYWIHPKAQNTSKKARGLLKNVVEKKSNKKIENEQCTVQNKPKANKIIYHNLNIVVASASNCITSKH